MKLKLIIILLGFTIISCKTNKKTNDISSFVNLKKMNVQASNCPDGINCTVDVLKGKDLIIAKNDIGKIYPKIIDGNKTVIKYLYKVAGTNSLTDGQQSELVLFVIDEDTKTKLENNDLKEIKLLFQKNCFCKDIFGYYIVEQGNFTVKTVNNKSEINIDFIIPKLKNQQLVNKIKLVIN